MHAVVVAEESERYGVMYEWRPRVVKPVVRRMDTESARWSNASST